MDRGLIRKLAVLLALALAVPAAADGVPPDGRLEFAAFRHGSEIGRGVYRFSGDAGQRALAAWALSWEEARRTSGTEWMAAILAHLLEDPYDAVRFIAARTLRKDELFAGLEYDFLGPPHERRVAKQSVLREWTAASRVRWSGPG